jgi:MFS family permease
VLNVPAGVLADRYDRRMLMMIGDGCSAIGILFILIAMLTGEASLAQICIGVFISSVFSALLEPSYRATITDILTKEEYSKASGLVSLAGSARYLFSPIIAGFLLGIFDVKLLLIIDICTFFLTVISTAVVKKGIATNVTEDKEDFIKSMKEGWDIITKKRGVFVLVIVSSFITLFLGIFQILAEPFILSFSDATTLGIAETVCACGMLISALYLGMRGIKNHYVKILGISFALSGLFMFGFRLRENMIIIGTFGFLFFATIPVCNNCLDYLARTNIPAEVQGRAWGFIGFISQIGYVVAYSISGIAADTIGDITGKGVGFGASMFIMISGILLIAISLWFLTLKSIKELENPII